jgi:hypothetical protein
MLRGVIFLMFCFLTTMAVGQEGFSNSWDIYALASGALDTTDVPIRFAGFSVGGAWRPSPGISLVADFGRLFNSDAHSTFDTFMAGGRLHSADHGRLSGFVELCVGTEKVSVGGQATSRAFAMRFGAGADIRLADRLVWRAIELDATPSRNAGPGIPFYRISSGFVIRLGR